MHSVGMALSIQRGCRSEPSGATHSTRCVNAHGFSLHAEVCCAAHERHKLEHLCRYITRPAIANERLTLNRAGDVVLQLKSPYHDGTTHVVTSPHSRIRCGEAESCPNALANFARVPPLFRCG